MKNYFILFLKGIAMGVANVIPGVSGGTIALITGIYEKLINSLKSFDTTAFKLIIKFDIKAFTRHTNLYFLIAVILSLAIHALCVLLGFGSFHFLYYKII